MRSPSKKPARNAKKWSTQLQENFAEVRACDTEVAVDYAAARLWPGERAQGSRPRPRQNTLPAKRKLKKTIP
jgi:hypothetical protein